MELNLVTLGATKLVNGVPVVQASSALTNGAEDLDDYGGVEMISQLGVSAVAAEADENGQAQGIVCEGLAGSNAVCIGGIDRRNAAVYGNLGRGDTAVYATGPKGVSQCLLKAEKRQAILATKGTDDTQILIVLDGKNDKLQLALFGMILEGSNKDGWSLFDKTGKGFHLNDGVLHVTAEIHYGGLVPSPFRLMMGPPTGSPGGPASVPLVAVPGVSIGM